MRLFLSLGLIGVILTSVFAAETGSIQGTLRDTDGALLVAADIKAERLDAKMKPVTTKTDGRGRYLFTGLPAGVFMITAYVDGEPRSRARVQTKAKGWAKVDFKLGSGEGDAARMQHDLQFGTSGH